MTAWANVVEGVLLFRDSCNVYAVVGPDGVLVVDAGSGRWLKHLDELPAPPTALACTHFFRDHAAGAAAAARAGIPVHVPEVELPLFTDPLLHFQQRETYVAYENYWHHFAPVGAIPVAGVLRDYERQSLGGVTVEIVPLPGVTVGQIGLAVRRGGRLIVACGETIHSPGRVARLAPLQWGYNDLEGAIAVVGSVRELRRRAPDVLLPSLGTPIVDDPDGALHELETALGDLAWDRVGPAAGVQPVPDSTVVRGLRPGVGELERVSDHVWRSTEAGAASTFVGSESGEALAIDYGYNLARGVVSDQVVGRPTTRRALLHSLDGLERALCTRRVAVVLVSHYHDDHVAGIPLLQRLQGTECWAAESFARILESPQDYAFPCTWHVPIRVDRELALGSTTRFHEIELTLGPAFSGHTRFAALIGFVADGVRYAHTGDQYHGTFSWDPVHEADWTRDVIAPNEVYRNGMLLDGYRRSARWLLDWRPDVVLTGHQRAFTTDDVFYERVTEHAQRLEDAHRRLMPLGDDEAHFDADSWGGWIRPYRTFLSDPGPAVVTVTVRNPLPRAARLDVSLVVPEGWGGGSASVEAGAREEAICELTLTAPTHCRRRPIAVDLVVAGHPYGQVAEALVTVGGDGF